MRAHIKSAPGEAVTSRALAETPKEVIDMSERNPLNTRRVPRMSRAHYQLIADVLRDAADLDKAVDIFARELKATNPRFDRDRFVDAAGGGC